MNKIISEYNLDCRYDSRKSFYGKARIIESEEIQDNIVYEVLELYSYDTLVARITRNKETCLSTCEYLGKYSQTTTRHQKEFFRQYRLSEKQIKELFDKGVIEVC